MMASFWPTADEQPWVTEPQAEYARLWRPMPKLVFSTTLEKADWNTRVVGDHIGEQIAALKDRSGGDLVLFGGARIAATFQREGLIDEYRIFVHPVILGGGTPLIPSIPTRTALRLVDVRTFSSPVVHLRYQVEGRER
jgi:dihydrofolate reductase